MASPIPKYLRTQHEIKKIPEKWINHISDLVVSSRVSVFKSKHPAKYQPGLPTELAKFAVGSIGDPMAGTGRFFEETRLDGICNDIDPEMSKYYDNLKINYTIGPADALPWKCDTLIFSPPYYPRTDRKKPNAHPAYRGEIVGFRDCYASGVGIEGFIGNPGGVSAILDYRNSMKKVYSRLRCCAERMVVVTKNWSRLGVELRLDLDTILMAIESGWTITERHGWTPTKSLWSKYNSGRGTGVSVEDILIFE